MFLWANDDSRQGNLYDMERNIKENLEYLETQIRPRSRVAPTVLLSDESSERTEVTSTTSTRGF